MCIGAFCVMPLFNVIAYLVKGVRIGVREYVF